ncbi:MAG: TerB family tellurite resistance protein [Deltaproteobacteria bacterium]|nr:MAG: TerB family tellurite resistance protein [Deltaproteobacteria bacterium]
MSSKKRFGGKLVGASVGWLLGGPWGAVFGGFLGHLYDKRDTPKIRDYRQIPKDELNYSFIFIANIVALLISVAKVDGTVKQEEVRVIKNFFRQTLGYSGEDLQLVRELIKRALNQDFDLRLICQRINKIFSYEERLALLRVLYSVAYADKVIKKSEEGLIDTIAGYLHISGSDRVSIKGEFVREKDKYYHILGIERNASKEEIKRAYWEMANKYHPDRVSHLGKEFSELAHQRIVQINEAYDRIKNERGL